MKAIFQIEKINVTLKDKDSFIDELRDTIEELKLEAREKGEENKDNHDLITNLKSAEMKIKSTFEAQYREMSDQNSAQFQRMKNIHEELEMKVEGTEKLLKEKENFIKKIELELA